jgi:hypothetical protein
MAVLPRYVPTCHGCGAGLSPLEQALALQLTSEHLLYNSRLAPPDYPTLALPVTLFCFACYEDDTPEPDVA